jgi:hypothetical protein
MTGAFTLLKAAGLTAAITLAMAGISQADTGSASTTPTAYKTTVAGKGPARFDWFANRNTSAPQTTTTTRRYAHGSGSWVCSPAGFGRKSTCRARN